MGEGDIVRIAATEVIMEPSTTRNAAAATNAIGVVVQNVQYIFSGGFSTAVPIDALHTVGNAKRG